MSRSTSVFALAFVCLIGAGAARAQDTPSDLVTRLDRLEETVRDLTGQIQELQYHNQQLQQQVQQLQGSAAPAGGMSGSMTGNMSGSTAPAGGLPPMVNAAPMAPAPRATVSTALPPPSATQYSTPPTAQYGRPQYGSPQYGAPAPVAASAPVADGHDAFNPALNPAAPGAPHSLGSSTTATEPPPVDPAMDSSNQPGAPLNLSTLPAQQANAAPSGGLPPPPLPNVSGTGGMPAGSLQEASLPPNATPKDEFDAGYGYVVHKNYGLAAETFRDFLHKFPGDRLTPEVQYWLGESLFQDQKYHDAAEAFLAVSTKYETSAKAPDALLRLGQSLAALGEKEAACASLGEVLRKYPHASIGVKQNVDREQKRVHC